MFRPNHPDSSMGAQSLIIVIAAFSYGKEPADSASPLRKRLATRLKAVALWDG
ncbi:Uncharacterised protein [Mycobacteroides abscessus subsp. bolletii]|nr:Uncharacterised protein [Mycobacteroides abscessus]SHO95969.1 Uncharacterised protein [Mycobacteroides abscessus subsp. bolletii]SIK71613.1 Uncharacterised protein [Mycobacteroides abscessus subsp. abscessus]SHR40560.1 Uncharacterised protein [Mycobacteroides abscessus subsp. bolletii]SHR69145.1 Uncharacterised protein [Mycobacteroides abscessus subsp. bolletii]